MKRLLLDLEKCSVCQECVVKCSYIFHPQNNGITSLRELATFALICRRCEEAPCVNSCYRNALKKDENGIIRRARFLCTGCKTCSIACPFGTILPDFLVFLDSYCECCLDKDKAVCVESCPYGAVKIVDIEQEDWDKGIYFVSDTFAVHSRRWVKDDAILYKKK